MNKKISRALDEISDKHLSEAETYRKPHRTYWFAAVAAVLAIVIAVGSIGRPGDPTVSTEPSVPILQGSIPDMPEPGKIQSPDAWELANLVAAPQYPAMNPQPDRNDIDAYRAWQKELAAQYDQPYGYADNLTDFFKNSIPLFLNAEENSAYSPLNVYMALAMLAETTDGASRQQILDALGTDSMEALRDQVGYMWNAHYQDDGETTLLLANSIWLDDAFDFRQDTADRLANDYFASAFHGDLGTESMNEQLRAWLNANTGGLLQEQAKNIEPDPNTAFALASTVYFSAHWESGFSEKFTRDEIFHCGDHDLLTPFLHDSFYGTYYYARNFSAVELKLSGENSMWLILPDEGFTVADILESEDYLELTMKPGAWTDKAGNIQIHLSLPKFDISSQADLSGGLQEMGIVDIFADGAADFSSLSDAEGLYVNRVDHAARVAIDEDGCVAAAFTVTNIYGGAIPPEKEVAFTLDRPFLFVISSRDDLPLFVGTVTEP